MSLRSKFITSNGSRNQRVLRLRWHSQPFNHRLWYRKISHAGRSTNTGKIILYSKGSITKRIKLLNIRYTNRFSSPLLLASITFTPFVHKLVNLFLLDSGSCFYFPTLNISQIFTLASIHRPSTYLFNSWFWNFHSFIYNLKTFKKISNLELIPNKGIQYARSSGSFAKMLTINLKQHVALIKLPSGVRKYFSVYSIALADVSSLPLKKKILTRQSGFLRGIGKKMKVRGVAKNPVDHPHGGRTKSIKYPRTPWGKTTKFK